MARTDHEMLRLRSSHYCASAAPGRIILSPLSRPDFVAAQRSPPVAIAPRRQPRAAGRQVFRHGIKAMAAPRMAATEPGEPHKSAGPEPVPSNGFIHVGRTGRQIAALPTEEGGKAQLIGADRIMCGTAGEKAKIHHELVLCRQSGAGSGRQTPAALPFCPQTPIWMGCMPSLFRSLLRRFDLVDGIDRRLKGQ